jgi:hypothetical protein
MTRPWSCTCGACGRPSGDTTHDRPFSRRSDHRPTSRRSVLFEIRVASTVCPSTGLALPRSCESDQSGCREPAGNAMTGRSVPSDCGDRRTSSWRTFPRTVHDATRSHPGFTSISTTIAGRGIWPNERPVRHLRRSTPVPPPTHADADTTTTNENLHLTQSVIAEPHSGNRLDKGPKART